MVAGETIRLNFSRIEKILGFALPASAYRYDAWWGNTYPPVQAASWMKAGWRRSIHSLQDEWVEFIKD